MKKSFTIRLERPESTHLLKQSNGGHLGRSIRNFKRQAPSIRFMFKENISLAEHTSYKIGGPARYFFEARNLGELDSAVREARKKNLPIFVLGGGTNLLVSDEGFDGLALKPDFHILEQDGNEVNVGAGVSISELLNYL